MQQHITLMDIYCGALGLGRIRVYNVTKNSNTSTHMRAHKHARAHKHKRINNRYTQQRNPPYTLHSFTLHYTVFTLLNVYINTDNTLIFMIISDRSNNFPIN